jgi:hypothetical protein
MRSKKLQLLGIFIIVLTAINIGIVLVAGQTEYSGQQWEYLTVDFSQSDIDYDFEQEEFVFADREPYSTMFAELVVGDCDPDGGTEFYNCLEQNRLGRAFYLEILGSDGWELIQVVNSSDQYSYKVELIFKRPK